MSKSRKVFIGVLLLTVIIQAIQPTRNLSDTLGDNDISKAYAISDDVHAILRNKCYDCHSNNTSYPWYTYIQPIGWWMAAHIHDGKEHLNFSEFKTYAPKKAKHKLEELSDAVNEGSMPLDTYIWMHEEAEISTADRDAINTWLKTLPLNID